MSRALVSECQRAPHRVTALQVNLDIERQVRQTAHLADGAEAVPAGHRSDDVYASRHTIECVPQVVTGREPELARLRSLVEEVSGSTAGSAVIEGVAGIGKTTLLNTVVAAAESQGFTVLGARAEELEQERNFGAIAAAVRSSGLDQDRAVSTELLQVSVGADSPFRSLDRVVETVEARALEGPVLLWLDDLQWADEWSARTVGILRRRLDRLPLAIIVGTRYLPRAAETAAALRVLVEGGVHLRLAPLDEKSVAELVRQRSASEPAPRLQRALERAGGNPFFVRELFDALERDGMLQAHEGKVDVVPGATPSSLLVTVLHRMSSLPEAELELLRTAAVLGGSFTVTHLAVVSGVAAEEMVKPLRRLREEGLLAEERDRFRFRHDLLREAVYEDLGGPLRVEMHSRVGHALAAAGADLVEVAHHFLRGASPGDTEAVESMIEVAQSGRVTLGEAAALLRRALELAPGHPQCTALKTRLAALFQETDAPGEAIPLLEEVLADTKDEAVQLDLMGALGVAALRAGDRIGWNKWRERAAERAAGLEGSTDSWVLLNVSQCEFDREEREEAHEMAARAAKLAASAGDLAAEEAAENQSTWLLTSMGRPQEALSHSRRVLELCAGRSAEPYRLLHHAQARERLWEDFVAAQTLAAARAKAEARGNLAVLLKVLSDLAWLDYSAGRWEDAALHADTELEIMREFRLVTDADHPGFVRAWLSFRSGDLESAERWRAETESMQRRSLSLWLAMRLRVEDDDIAGAVQLAKAIVDHAPKYPSHRFLEDTLPEVARIAIGISDEELAQQALNLIRRYAAGASAPSLELAALRCDALVERDAAAAERALTLARDCPRPLARAATFEDAAFVLRDRKDRLIAEAERIYDLVGAAVDVGRLRRARGAHPRRARSEARPVSGWGSLTDAEQRVVELAAEGLTNREIGERLYISHRTVSTHLAHVFDKLQVRSRVELAREAAARKAAASSA